MSNDNLRILGMGNPLLDISTVVDDKLFKDWGCEPGNAILAEEKHAPMYDELIKTHAVEYIAGGATQNSIRVAQWMCGATGATAYIGAVGSDKQGTDLEQAARADGVNVQYHKVSEPTGKCAVLVTGKGERALITTLAAANCYDKKHFDSAPIQDIVNKTKIIYSAGFFLTVSPPTMVAAGQHTSSTGKTFCMNLSAPFIMQVPPFMAALKECLPYVDFLFGNESEAATYGEVEGWGTDVATIALKLASLPKASGTRPRVVVFTQGKDPTLVACGGVISSFPVPVLEKEKLVDTNGAGDAFVGGFLAYLAKGGDLMDCVSAGHWAARQIIQVSGCKIPSGVTYKP